MAITSYLTKPTFHNQIPKKNDSLFQKMYPDNVMIIFQSRHKIYLDIEFRVHIGIYSLFWAWLGVLPRYILHLFGFIS